MIFSEMEIQTALYLMMVREREAAYVYAEAAEEINDPRLKKIFKELEQCARHYHGRLYDCLDEISRNKKRRWLANALGIELTNQNLYNELMVQITDLPTREMMRQLRDAKMRTITLLQEELKNQT